MSKDIWWQSLDASILELCGAGVLDFSNVQNMRHLINLRDIRNSGFVFPNSGVPGFADVGELKSLRELCDFRVRKDKGYELKQLKSINHLRGRLRISGLESVESKQAALDAKLTDKKHLTSLSLEWSGQQHSCSPDLQVEILEGLCPPSQLTELEIRQYNGLRCPSWLSSENLNGLLRNLQDLQLCRCNNLEDLPKIRKLFICIRRLRLIGLPKLKRLPRLPDRLENLQIEQCNALVVTCREDVNMIRCNFVEQATRTEPSLNVSASDVVQIDRFSGEQPDRFDTILCNIFGRCGNLPGRLIRGHVREEDYSQSALPASVVDRLIISYCFVTDTVLHSCLRGSANLVSLNLRCLPFLTAIPCEVMKFMAKLSDLSIEDCLQFAHLQGLNHLSRLQHLTIAKCPKLRALGEDEKVGSLHGLSIDDIPLVPQLLSRKGCSSLWSLRIDESEELREEGILEQLTSLTSLDFSCCNWNKLPENLANLTSLEHLRLDCCKKIQSLPALPASLRSFEVEECDPLFMKSCQKDGDPNCQKIANVLVKRFSSYP
ncbi:putative disease resistance RPP13-like protein 1 [Oryza brachyantha]|uniref:putative disease resistance RPP13-like protein 1 n=1 Tax=Oryza brachyantha TaxID=4533 RepID=UPI0003EAAEA7|nr:putative disease resistance RPP13-like protein 1 [Oryza brachyantha]